MFQTAIQITKQCHPTAYEEFACVCVHAFVRFNRATRRKALVNAPKYESAKHQGRKGFCGKGGGGVQRNRKTGDRVL